MLHKELEMFFIAYNLIRCVMVQAATLNDAPCDRMSFKGTVDSVRQFSLAIAQAHSKKKQNQLVVELLEVIARDEVPERLDRREPRAVKRRPKPFPCSIDLATNSGKSVTVIVTGKATPENPVPKLSAIRLRPRY